MRSQRRARWTGTQACSLQIAIATAGRTHNRHEETQICPRSHRGRALSTCIPLRTVVAAAISRWQQIAYHTSLTGDRRSP